MEGLEANEEQQQCKAKITDEDFDAVTEFVTKNLTQLIRQKVQARVTTTLTIVGNRIVTTQTQNLLNKARQSFMAKTLAAHKALAEKEKAGETLSESEQKKKEKLSQKLDDYTKAHDIQQHSEERAKDIKEGGKIGLPEMQEIANKENVVLVIEYEDGTKVELKPEGVSSSKTVYLKENEPGHVVPRDQIPGFEDKAFNDNDCALRAILASKNGCPPSAEEIRQLRNNVAEAASKSRALQINNFNWREDPIKLRQVGRRKAAEDAINPPNITDKLLQKIKGSMKRRLGAISKSDTQKCAPSAYEDIKDADPNRASKHVAAKAHSTAEGEAFNADPSTGRKNTLNHMVSENDAKEILMDRVEDYLTATTPEEKATAVAKIEKTVDQLCCDNELQNTLGKTYYARESMKSIKQGLKELDDRNADAAAFYLRDGFRTCIGSPGNTRIGDRSLNNSVNKCGPDFIDQNDCFAKPKIELLNEHKNDLISKNREVPKSYNEPYRQSSSTPKPPTTPREE